jgi:hypothetical protein
MQSAAGAVSGACYSGPPTFLHVNGITYRPVAADTVGTDPAESACSAGNANPSTLSPGVQGGGVAVAPPIASSPNTMVMQEREFKKFINERVKAKVDSYLGEKLLLADPAVDSLSSSRGGVSHSREHHHTPSVRGAGASSGGGGGESKGAVRRSGKGGGGAASVRHSVRPASTPVANADTMPSDEELRAAYRVRAANANMRRAVPAW